MESARVVPDQMGSDRHDDDATNEHYAMAFVEEEGTRSSFQGSSGDPRAWLFSALYTDRGAITG